MLPIFFKYLYIGWNTESFCVPWLLPIKEVESNVSNFFNSFRRTKCFFVFELIFGLRPFNFWLSLAAKCCAVCLLNSGVLMYFSWLWSRILAILKLTKILTSGNLFSTEVNAEVVTKPLKLGILFSNSAILVL